MSDLGVPSLPRQQGHIWDQLVAVHVQSEVGVHQLLRHPGPFWPDPQPEETAKPPSAHLQASSSSWQLGLPRGSVSLPGRRGAEEWASSMSPKGHSLHSDLGLPSHRQLRPYGGHAVHTHADPHSTLTQRMLCTLGSQGTLCAAQTGRTLGVVSMGRGVF